MAIEKMKTVGIVGKIDDIDKVCKAIVLNGSMHMLNALAEVNSNHFKLSASEENIEAIEESINLRSYQETKDFAKEEEIIKALDEIFNLKFINDNNIIDIDNDYNKMVKDIEEEYSFVKELCEEIEENKKQVLKKESYISNLKYLQNLQMKIEELLGMKYLDFRMLRISRENYSRLKGDYENIPSLMFRLETIGDNVILMTATPKSLGGEIERLLTSLNCQELPLPKEYTGSAVEIINVLNEDIKSINEKIEGLKNTIKSRKNSILPLAKKVHMAMKLEKEVEAVKKEGAIGKRLFFLFGYVPSSRIEALQRKLNSCFDNLILSVDDAKPEEAAKAPPTKFKNNWLIRPFETLIGMYGLPSYDEADPTAFFGLSYMLLFGAMFGDVGQGFVILLAGLYLIMKKKSIEFGGVLTRLGGSSIVFGFLYGSVFGNEHILPALFIKPMANINTMLMLAIGLGITLMTVGFIYSLINNLNRRDLEEGLFGREGLTGFLFFITLIIAILNSQLSIVNLPFSFFIITMIVLLLINVFKQPIANKIKGSEKLHKEGITNYYTEAGFGVVETLLSFLSNTISFVRVGAFALNHAGLYLAFETMAGMINSGFGGIIILILGNVVIIGLEGLIVFIQGLRLEYYELFSRYYTGKGIKYMPAKLDYSNNFNK